MRSIKIGRSNQCDIVISGDEISRDHAEISRNGNEFIYYDMSSNGSNIGGRMIHNERVAVAPGATILMANRIPVPWSQVYAMLGLDSGNGEMTARHITDDRLGVGWGILSFLIPLAGLIMYFTWRKETPKRASLAGILGIISFVLQIIVNFYGI